MHQNPNLMGHQERQDLFEEIYAIVRGKFQQWLLLHLYHLSQKNTRQLFYLTLVAEWKGLASGGLNIFGKGRSMLPAKTYRRHKKLQLAEQTEKIIHVLRSRPYVLWIDNYNKDAYARHVPQVGQSGYSIGNWTALALSNLRPLFRQHLLLPDQAPDGFPMLSCPLCGHLFGYGVLQTLEREFGDRQFNAPAYCPLWKKSRCQRLQAFTTPLRDPRVLQTQDDLIWGSATGLRDFQTVRLIEKNITKVTVLHDILKEIRTVLLDNGHCFLVKCDIQIYWRIVKVSTTDLILKTF